MKTGPTIARGKSRQDYATPWAFIHACEKKFRGKVILDLAASVENAKAEHFFNESVNSLSISWAEYISRHYFGTDDRRWCFLNPPFDNIAPWARKCAEESRKGARILFLTPASVGSNWFRDHVHGQAHVYALNGRITFEGAEDPYPKDCILSVFRPKTGSLRDIGFDVWAWPGELMKDEMF